MASFFSLLSNYSLSVSSSQRCSKYSWERKQIASHNYLLCELWLCKKRPLFLSKLVFLWKCKKENIHAIIILQQFEKKKDSAPWKIKHDNSFIRESSSNRQQGYLWLWCHSRLLEAVEDALSLSPPEADLLPVAACGTKSSISPFPPLPGREAFAPTLLNICFVRAIKLC